MYKFGHFGAALLVYAPLGATVSVVGDGTLAVIGAVVCVSLSTVPDCDQYLPGTEHRGATHTVLFGLLVGTLLAAIATLVGNYSAFTVDRATAAFVFVVGTLSIYSHLLADVITPMGIRPFRPLSDRHYTLSLTRAANPTANYLLLLVGLGVTAVITIVVSIG
ncbi:metal-dependent hydrolase [Halobacteria archaeon AArc-m2/3/4]|uniref:Metal-dependent hydrolase n=1 Tax=Natronoglomus mannanivorans TaxID=2979990 RepID=A0AAP2Z248_9EURY|nr:metal-dependent hydrolase [Halobacteria archaeon AArc-xg1-1]MCU4973891.1 metal-dependent hydrolase [Halobacteria archaeon AArc-m2/3/4]